MRKNCNFVKDHIIIHPIVFVVHFLVIVIQVFILLELKIVCIIKIIIFLELNFLFLLFYKSFIFVTFTTDSLFVFLVPTRSKGNS